MALPTGELVGLHADGSAALELERLPILPELQAVLDATPVGNMTFLVTELGGPFTPDGFGNWFRDRGNDAGLTHCSAHGLRKAGATIAAGNGATEHQLMALYGWESPKQAAVHTRKANRKRLSGDAMHLVVPSKKRTSPSHISIPTVSSGKEMPKRHSLSTCYGMDGAQGRNRTTDTAIFR